MSLINNDHRKCVIPEVVLLYTMHLVAAESFL